MDLATLIGIIGAFIVVIYSMVLSGGLMMFFDFPSVLMVVVGSVFVVLMKFSMSQFLGAVKVAGRAFSYKIAEPTELIAEVVLLADSARKGGLLTLEGKEVSSDFLKRGIQLLVDGHEADVVKGVLKKDLNQTIERHDTGQKIWRAFGDVAPAMGMIGTLVGLVAMLANMSDPKSIGPAMAVALLTTFYGAVLANMVAMPIADKLVLRKAEEARTKSMMIDGLLGIQAGQNPRVIEEMLRTYLAPKQRIAKE
jgi:chemotaxis protein MotA